MRRSFVSKKVPGTWVLRSRWMTPCSCAASSAFEILKGARHLGIDVPHHYTVFPEQRRCPLRESSDRLILPI